MIDALVEGLNVGLGIAGTVMTAADTLVPWYESMLKVSGLILDEVVRGMEDAHADDGDRAKRAGMAVTWALSNKRPEAALRWRGPRGWQDLDGFRRKIEAT
ncbi:MAG: hypothetical protein GWN73_07045, partial [Actinobacteria bacterium]|nr:hypothetical protein [Actinomycetota bacterium]